MTLIFFTDLDGTLLDHQTYDFSPALPALQALRNKDIPLVLASSKTAAELQQLRSTLDLEHWPTIVENGAGALGPNEAPGEDDSEYRRLRTLLNKLPDSLRQQYRGFGDMNSNEVAALTGLSPQSARLAKQRAYTEPGLFSGSAIDRKRLIEKLHSLGISARDGGRFLTLSFGQTKAEGLKRIARQYRIASRPEVTTVALGDAPNDRDMLLAATKAIVVRNDHAPDIGEIPGAIYTSLPGPRGWNEAVLSVLESGS